MLDCLAHCLAQWLHAPKAAVAPCSSCFQPIWTCRHPKFHTSSICSGCPISHYTQPDALLPRGSPPPRCPVRSTSPRPWVSGGTTSHNPSGPNTHSEQTSIWERAADKSTTTQDLSPLHTAQNNLKAAVTTPSRRLGAHCCSVPDSRTSACAGTGRRAWVCCHCTTWLQH